ncbi:MAG TPA: hypothetical protein VLY46_16540 [Usitatibacter sp.]|nr:hypothetical protein [Usitatibacter sp.]
MTALRILAALALLAATACAHAVGRMADLQVQDRATGRALPVYWHEGRPYIAGEPGHEYRVVLANRRGEDLLAVVSVDGVNVLSGETANPGQGGYVLGPWRRVEIDGWRKSLDQVAAFYFTSLGDSYAGRTGRPANVGVIGVALFRRAEPPPPPWQDIAPEAKDESASPARAQGAPSSEPFSNRPSSGAAAKRVAPAVPAMAAPLGTGHGRREDSPVRYVDFQRASEFPVETVTLYYDSYANLLAQGIVPRRACRRRPDPFPARFVPDPS